MTKLLSILVVSLLLLNPISEGGKSISKNGFLANSESNMKLNFTVDKEVESVFIEVDPNVDNGVSIDILDSKGDMIKSGVVSVVFSNKESKTVYLPRGKYTIVARGFDKRSSTGAFNVTVTRKPMHVKNKH